MGKNIIFNLCIGLCVSCGCSAMFQESSHSSLKDKNCGCNEVTSTDIRMEYITSPGYHHEMTFTTLDKIFLFRDRGFTVVNANTKDVTRVNAPKSEEREYYLSGNVIDAENNTVVAGSYVLKSDSSWHSVIYYVDANLNFRDITPSGYETGGWKSFTSFFYNSFLYVTVGIGLEGAMRPTSFRLLKYDIAAGLKLVEDRDLVDIWWAFADPSSDNLIWSYNANLRDDPSRIIFSFDGSNYTYYGPGVAQNGPAGSFAIDANNIFIGYYSGVVWQYDSGEWIKHAICSENEAGYCVEEVWASSKDNVFIAGSTDIVREQNFAYHYDGKCWTRWFKGDGSRNISHIWGTPDGSAVLALDDEGDLYRLYVEK